jgi:hypothetical protein
MDEDRTELELKEIKLDQGVSVNWLGNDVIIIGYTQQLERLMDNKEVNH